MMILKCKTIEPFLGAPMLAYITIGGYFAMNEASFLLMNNGERERERERE